MKVMAYYSHNYNSEVSAEELSYKWGIGLEKVKATLGDNTHIYARSAIMPLDNRYQTDLLSRKIRRLGVKFFTDILFYDDTSVQVDKVSQIYADRGGFVHVLLMRYKAGVGDSLGNLVNNFFIIN